jgi:hypothetical protein
MTSVAEAIFQASMPRYTRFLPHKAEGARFFPLGTNLRFVSQEQSAGTRNSSEGGELANTVFLLRIAVYS